MKLMLEGECVHAGEVFGPMTGVRCDEVTFNYQDVLHLRRAVPAALADWLGHLQTRFMPGNVEHRGQANYEAAKRIRAFFDKAAKPTQRGYQRRVVCAAIRAADGELLLGVRHYSTDMHVQIAARHDGDKFKLRLDEDQGFVDQHGQWLNRREAYLVAEAAGQITDKQACTERLDVGPVLYSEGLY